jgi:hypothetical protein
MGRRVDAGHGWRRVAGRYPSRRVGGGSIVELWVPAEELTDFNCHIVGQIRVVAEFPGAAAGP